MDKLSYKTLILIVVLLLIPIVFLIRLRQKPVDVLAGWWNDAWMYRTAINVATHNVGETNVYIIATVNIGSTANLQPDGGDFRITDQTGNLLPYYIASGLGSTAVVLHIQIADFPADTSTYYAYYGNPAAVNGFTAADFATQATNYSLNYGNREQGGGPAAYWKFNEGVGTSVYDSISGLHHGTFGAGTSAPAWTTPDQCVTGNCLYFNTSQKVTIGSTVPFVQSVAFWIRPSTTAVAVIDLDGGTHYISGASGRLSAGGFTTPSIYINGIATTAFTANVWQQVVVATGTSFAATSITIGKAGSSFLNGYLSDIKLYPYARTAAMAKLDYNSRSTPQGASAALGSSSQAYLSQGLVGYWKFDETGVGATAGFPVVAGKGIGYTSTADTTLQQVDLPDNISAGDLLLIMGGIDQSSGTFTWPAGWTQLYLNPDGGGASHRGFAGYRIADGTEGNGTTMTITTSSESAEAIIWRITNWYGSGAPEFIGVTGATTTPDPPSLTPSWGAANTLWIAHVGFNPNGSLTGYPATYTDNREVYYGQSAGAGSAAGDCSRNLNGASDDPGTFSLSSAGGWDANTIAIRPAADSPPTFIDSSGNGNTGAPGAGSSAPASGNGKFGLGANFAVGSSGKYITVSSSPSLDDLSAFTYAIWVNPAQTQGTTKFFGKSGTYGLYIDNVSSSNRVQFSMQCGTDVNVLSNAGDALPNNTWSHVAVTWDGVSCALDHYKVFINGNLISKHVNSVGSTGVRSSDSGDPLTIGNQYSSYNRQFLGTLDEARVYNRVLSPPEISALAGFAPGPVGYWKLDEKSGTRIDSSGNGNDLTDNNSVGSAVGKLDTAANFVNGAGQQEYLGKNITTSSALNITGPLTLCAWVKPRSVDPDFGNNIFGKWSSHHGYQLTLDDFASSFRFDVAADDSSDVVATSAYSIINYTWQYLCGTYDGSYLRTYYNGYQSGTPQAYTGSIQSVADEFRISGAAGIYFDGQVDEVKVYNYARTPKQITQDMNFNRPDATFPAQYYKFDEGVGSSLHNSGYNNKTYISTTTMDGIMAAGTSAPTFTTGHSNLGLQFDGTKQYFSIATGLANTLKAWSVSFWAKPGTDTTPIMSLGTGVSVAITSNAINVSGFGTPSVYVNGVATTAIAANTWSHVVINAGASFSDGPLTIGMAGTSFYNGVLDDLKFFAAPLIPDQILADYNSASAVKFGQTNQTIGGTTTTLNYCLPGDTTACSPPVGEWNFDEGTGTTAYDSSGSNFPGVWQGTLGSQWAPGKSGTAGNFDGSSNYVDMGNPAGLQLTSTPISISAWIYLTEAGSLHNIVAKKGNTGNFGYRLWTNNNLLNMEVSGDGTTLASQIGTATLNTNTWYHVGGVYIPGNSISLYVNGVADGKNTTAIPASVYNSTANFVLGASSAGTQNLFAGKIDNVRIYNYARTPAQIAYDYNRGGPAAWWKLDECQGTIIHNSAGIGLSGTITAGIGGTQTTVGTCAAGGNTVWGSGASGKYGGSLSLDGYDDYAEVPANFTINGIGKTAFTVSAWINAKSAGGGGYGRVIDKRNNTTDASGVGYGIYLIDRSGKVGLDGNVGMTTTNAVSTSVAAFDYNTWHQVVMVFNGNVDNKVYLYADGQLLNDASVKQAGSGTVADDSAVNLRIGAYAGGGTRNFDGNIDDVRFYPYALTPSQIKTAYTNGAASFGQ